MLAQFPQHIYSLDSDGVHINLYEPGSLQFADPDGELIELHQETRYPFDGVVTINVHTAIAVRFTLRLRIPGWCTDWQLQVNGVKTEVRPGDSGYVALDHTWQPGDSVTLTMDMPVQMVTDRLGNPGKVAFVRGPLVYAADSAYLDAGALLDDVVVNLEGDNRVKGITLLTDEASGYQHLMVPTLVVHTSAGDPIWREGLRYSEFLASATEHAGAVRLVPFFDAGNRDELRYRDGIWPHWHDPARRITFQVWLPFACPASDAQARLL